MMNKILNATLVASLLIGINLHTSQEVTSLKFERKGVLDKLHGITIKFDSGLSIEGLNEDNQEIFNDIFNVITYEVSRHDLVSGETLPEPVDLIINYKDGSVDNLRQLLEAKIKTDLKNAWFSFARKHKKRFNYRRLLDAVQIMRRQMLSASKGNFWTTNFNYTLHFNDESADAQELFLFYCAMLDVADALQDLFGIKIVSLPDVRISNKWYQQIGRDVVAAAMIAAPLVASYALYAVDTNVFNEFKLPQNDNQFGLARSSAFGGLLGASAGAATQWYRYRGRRIPLGMLMKNITKGSIYGGIGGASIGTGVHYLKQPRLQKAQKLTEFDEKFERDFNSIMHKLFQEINDGRWVGDKLKRFFLVSDGVRVSKAIAKATIEKYQDIYNYIKFTPITKINEKYSFARESLDTTEWRRQEILQGLADEIASIKERYNLS